MRNVKAILNFSKSRNSENCETSWFIDKISCPNGTIKKNFESDPVQVLIQDLRGREHEVRLDETGFQPINFPTLVDTNVLLEGGDAVRDHYYKEIESLLKQVTGANRIVIFHHSIRHSQRTVYEEPLHRAPALRVHVDQTPVSADARIRLHAPNGPPYQRAQIINVWRPIKDTVYDYPLALADFRTLDVERDLVKTELRFPPWLDDKETFSVKYNPNQKWYYWSRMTPNEVLIFKCYDSQSQKLASFNASVGADNLSLLRDVSGLAPHSAFLDEEGEASGIKRQSIEVRALAFHD